MKITHKGDVDRKRRNDYPPWTVAADALYALATQMKKAGTTLPPETQAFVDRCNAVKAKYPKGK